ncbi:hypothetical protein B0T25DRAFT_517156 [Lasiosphaeria hispida]|uniref:Integral membrane protein n=1 Tax=Lasiosphaeria hispida TaxID=260671 RepID=A0AAJ0MGG3_9PEZI|nr:hypothetical protein B0T25DRAFT_517156 [Lasiosphaeria hispida]
MTPPELINMTGESTITPPVTAPPVGTSPATLFFGMFLGVFVFALAKVIGQTMAIWRRTKSVANAYLAMIWVEAWVNLIFALVTFLYMPINKIIPGSLAFYLGTIVLWSIQTQLLTQIIVNRVALIMASRRKARLLRWSLFGVIGCINISVGVIWTSATLPGATPAQKRLNFAYENVQKSLFLIIDLSLNLFFLYLVRFRLIADGLTKYWELYNFNAWIVVIATSMDVIPLGMLNHPNVYLYVSYSSTSPPSPHSLHPSPLTNRYVQFAPLSYIVKLHIELIMAVLISKVVKHSNSPSHDGLHNRVLEHNLGASPQVAITSGKHAAKPSVASFLGLSGSSASRDVDMEGEDGVVGSEIPLEDREGRGIVKTVETTVVVNHGHGSRGWDTRDRGGWEV